jgi:uncharacterized membrane protein
MMRWLLWIFSGALLGGIVHLVAILVLPQTATHDAYSRLLPKAPLNAFVAFDPPSPQNEALPFSDPALAMSVCRYDLGGGPIKFTAPVSAAYTSVTFYTRRGIAYYAINDRSAGRRVIELELMTAAQRARLPDDEEVTAADRLIVESPTLEGLIVLRAPEPGQMPVARAAVAAGKCEVQKLPD